MVVGPELEGTGEVGEEEGIVILAMEVGEMDTVTVTTAMDTLLMAVQGGEGDIEEAAIANRILSLSGKLPGESLEARANSGSHERP